MPRLADVGRVKQEARSSLAVTLARYDRLWRDPLRRRKNYGFVRWVAAMSAVEGYATWERYAERRLAVALAHHPGAFLAANNLTSGLKRVPIDLAFVLVRSGSTYFDFRSSADLLGKADRLVGSAHNPFRAVPKASRLYLDTLGAIRNYVVHKSDTALRAYKRHLTEAYSIKAKPQPEEFLNAIDFRRSSPARYQPRLKGLVAVIQSAIDVT